MCHEQLFGKVYYYFLFLLNGTEDALLRLVPEADFAEAVSFLQINGMGIGVEKPADEIVLLGRDEDHPSHVQSVDDRQVVASVGRMENLPVGKQSEQIPGRDDGVKRNLQHQFSSLRKARDGEADLAESESCRKMVPLASSRQMKRPTVLMGQESTDGERRISEQNKAVNQFS